MATIAARLVDELGYDPEREPAPRELADVDLSTLPAGDVIAARDRGRFVAIARLTSGKVVVVDDECPHDGGRISDGYIVGETIVCARHGWELKPCAGKCVRVG